MKKVTDDGLNLRPQLVDLLYCIIRIVDYFCKSFYRLCHGSGGQSGVWRSWLAYLHGVQVVVCSSHITPTKFESKLRYCLGFFLIYNKLFGVAQLDSVSRQKVGRSCVRVTSSINKVHTTFTFLNTNQPVIPILNSMIIYSG